MSIWIYQPNGANLQPSGGEAALATHGDKLEVGDSLTTSRESAALFTASGATITLGPNTRLTVLSPSWRPNWYLNYSPFLVCAWYPEAWMRAWYPDAWTQAWYPDISAPYLTALQINRGTIVGCLRELDGISHHHFELPSAVASSQNSDLALTVDCDAMQARASCSRGLVRLALEDSDTHLIGSDKSAEFDYCESGEILDTRGCSPIPPEDLSLIESSIWDWKPIGEFIIKSISACSGEIEFADDLPVDDLPKDVLPSMLGLIVSDGPAANESSIFAAFDPRQPSRATLLDCSWLEDIIRPGEDKAMVYTKIKRAPDQTC